MLVQITYGREWLTSLAPVSAVGAWPSSHRLRDPMTSHSPTEESGQYPALPAAVWAF